MVKHSSVAFPLRSHTLRLAFKRRPRFPATLPFLHTELSDWSTLKLQPRKPSPFMRSHDHPFQIHGKGFWDECLGQHHTTSLWLLKYCYVTLISHVLFSEEFVPVNGTRKERLRKQVALLR